MTDVLSLAGRRFDEVGLRGQVLLSQLPLNVVMLLTAVILWFAAPSKLTAPEFVAGQASALALLGLCAAVPWQRLPYGLVMAVPLLDFLPVGLVRSAAQDVVAALGLLAVFPLLWLAGCGYRPRLLVPLGTAAALLVAWAPLLSAGTITAGTLSSQLLYPFMMLAIATATAVMTSSLRQQDARTQELLEQSQTREQLLETVLETVGVGVLVVDADGHEVIMNARQHRLHRAALPDGADNAPEPQLLVYRDGERALVPVDRRPAARAVAGEEFADEVYRLGGGSSARTVSVTARDFRDAGGNRAGAVLSFTDITEVLAAMRARDTFVAAMSHEFRTPLTSIVGYTELLQDEPSIPAPARSDLKVVSRNARHLKRMVEDVLAAATGDEAAEAVQAELDLAELVRRAASTAAPEAEQQGVAIDVRVEGRVPVLGDRTALVRILDNLVSNAMKYSHQGTTIALSAGAEDGWAVATVQDQGIGMSPQDVARAFTRFHRSEHARSSGIPGTGLGLALAREAALRHGGRLECTSELGAGTTFTLRLPVGASGKGTG